jgi:hypothetical protein
VAKYSCFPQVTLPFGEPNAKNKAHNLSLRQRNRSAMITLPSSFPFHAVSDLHLAVSIALPSPASVKKHLILTGYYIALKVVIRAGWNVKTGPILGAREKYYN